MIEIGLTGWGDHDSLYPSGTPGRSKLHLYSAHFPVVEVDSSFYAIQSVKSYEKWVNDTPERFGFIIKAYQGMTGHQRGEPHGEETFAAFRESIRPVLEAGKLRAVLFQYPPWFDCTRENVDLLRNTKAGMGDIPVALEFRNRTWFTPQMAEKTLGFMEREGWIHSICDEPQAGIGSVPIVAHATHPERTIVRFHGRNVQGWNRNGQTQGHWRETRYLYRYSNEELLEWMNRLNKLAEQTGNLCVLFNNNSGGDAADNAKMLMELMKIDYEGLAPRQLDLF